MTNSIEDTLLDRIVDVAGALAVAERDLAAARADLARRTREVDDLKTRAQCLASSNAESTKAASDLLTAFRAFIDAVKAYPIEVGSRRESDKALRAAIAAAEKAIHAHEIPF